MTAIRYSHAFKRQAVREVEAGLRSRRDRAQFAFVFRGWRSCLAQPPANGSHPSGMPVEPGGPAVPEPRGWAMPEPGGWAVPEPGGWAVPEPGGWAVPEPGGFKAISRWLRRIAPTPPDLRRPAHRIPEGCQRGSRSSSAMIVGGEATGCDPAGIGLNVRSCSGGGARASRNPRLMAHIPPGCPSNPEVRPFPNPEDGPCPNPEGGPFPNPEDGPCPNPEGSKPLAGG